MARPAAVRPPGGLARFGPKPGILVMLGLGFASGLPFPLVGKVLRQWLTESHVGLGFVGATAALGMPYGLKFLWAFVFDRYAPPFRLVRFGRRRGWLFVLQPSLMAACLLLASTDPGRGVGATLAAASVVALLSASQDVLIDAWRIGAFPPDEQGGAVAAYVWGYRVALLAGFSGSLALVRWIGWPGSLALVAALLLIGPVATFAAWEAPAAPPVRLPAGPSWTAPLRDLWRRPGIGWALAFVALFKLGEVLAGTMAPSFYRVLGFDRGQVAIALGPPSLAAALAGTACGGALVARRGVGGALVLAGIGQTATMGLYVVLAFGGPMPSVLYAKVLSETFAEAMADTAFLALLSGLCRPAFAAGQYALLSSLAVLGLHSLGSLSGLLAGSLGWVGFYLAAMLASLPALTILYLRRRDPTFRWRNS